MKGGEEKEEEKQRKEGKERGKSRPEEKVEEANEEGREEEGKGQMGRERGEGSRGKTSNRAVNMPHKSQSHSYIPTKKETTQNLAS